MNIKGPRNNKMRVMVLRVKDQIIRREMMVIKMILAKKVIVTHSTNHMTLLMNGVRANFYGDIDMLI